MPVVALHRDVEPRTQLLDELQLAQQRRELARRVFPVDRVRLAENARSFFFRVRAPEVAHEARTNALRLADVEHLAVAGEHPVDARPVLRGCAHIAAQRRDATPGLAGAARS